MVGCFERVLSWLREVSREELSFSHGAIEKAAEKNIAFKTLYDIFEKNQLNGFAYIALGS